MAILTAQVAGILNEVLTAELAAIGQRFLHAGTLKRWWSAEALAGRILSLHGTPVSNGPLLFPTGQTLKEQFENELKAELDAVARLTEAIKLLAEAADIDSRELLEKILVDREEQVDWLEAQLFTIREIGIDNYLASELGEHPV
jgi:bacterioferritin